MKIYILSLMVDQRHGSSNTTESQWISMDKAKIEKKKETEMQKLLDYFGIKQPEPMYIDECPYCDDDFEAMKDKELGKGNWDFEDPGVHEEFEEFIKNREKCGASTFFLGKEHVCGCNHEDLDNGFVYEINPIKAKIEELEKKGRICYGNRDLDSFPSLTIEEVKVTKKVKEL